MFGYGEAYLSLGASYLEKVQMGRRPLRRRRCA